MRTLFALLLMTTVTYAQVPCKQSVVSVLHEGPVQLTVSTCAASGDLSIMATAMYTPPVVTTSLELKDGTKRLALCTGAMCVGVKWARLGMDLNPKITLVAKFANGKTYTGYAILRRPDLAL